MSTKLRVLDLRGNKLRSADVRKLCKAVSVSPSLTSLGLSGNLLDAEAAETIALAVDRSTRIHFLDLSSNKLGVQGAPFIAQMIAAANCPLIQLDLWNNDIGAEGCAHIARSLGSNAKLQRLCLGNNTSTSTNNGGGGATGGSFAGSVSSRSDGNSKFGGAPQLAVLNRGDIICDALTYSMRQNRALRDLDLKSSEITAAGCALLAAALHEHPSLVRLSLANNPRIESAGMDALATLFAQPVSSIMSLDLSNTTLQDRGAMRLCGCLAASSSLTDVNLASNGITDVGAEALARAMTVSPRLAIMDLTDNEIGSRPSANSMGGALMYIPAPPPPTATGGGASRGGGTRDHGPGSEFGSSAATEYGVGSSPGVAALIEALQQNRRITSLALLGNERVTRLTLKKIDVILSERRPREHSHSTAMIAPGSRPSNLPLQ